MVAMGGCDGWMLMGACNPMGFLAFFATSSGLRWQSGAGVCDHTVDGPPVKARWTGFTGPAELFTVADGTGSVEVGVAGVQGTVYGDRQGVFLA